MSMREDLERAIAEARENAKWFDHGSPDESLGDRFLRDHGHALLEAVRDSDRINQLELSQRADVYWHENGEQELAGYEWGTAGQYSTARDALDAAILARTKAIDAERVK